LELAPQVLGSVYDQGAQVTQGFRACTDCTGSRRQQDVHRFSIASATRLSEVITSQCLALSPNSVKLVGFCAVAASRARRSVDLGDRLPVLEQEDGQPCAIAPSALDRPEASARCQCSSKLEHLPIACCVRLHGQMSEYATRLGMGTGRRPPLQRAPALAVMRI
jgi:hypothetical protein